MTGGEHEDGNSGAMRAAVLACALAVLTLCCVIGVSSAATAVPPPPVPAAPPVAADHTSVAGHPDGSGCHEGGPDAPHALLPAPVPSYAPASPLAFPCTEMTGGAGIRGPSYDAVRAVDPHRLQVQRT